MNEMMQGNSSLNVEKLIFPKIEDDINKIYLEIQKYVINEINFNKKFLKFFQIYLTNILCSMIQKTFKI